MRERFLSMFWMAIAIVGLGLSVSSCKDDDDDEKNGDNTEQKSDAQYQARDVFWNVVSQLVNPDDITDDYLDKTFEPTIGEVSESNPLVRIVAVNDLASAAQQFAHLVDANIDENTPSYEYSNSAVGTLTYTRTNDGQSLATVDVNIKQLPTLQQIKFMSPEQAGDNGLFGFSGTAYYRFGDVIKRVNSSGITEYWVCVRPAFSKEGKSGSYWATLSPLPEEKIHSYTYKGKTWNVPTALGNDLTQIQNFAELLYAIMDPDDWYKNVTGSPAPKFFDDFSVKNVDYHNQYFFKRVFFAWNHKSENQQNLFKTIFNMEDVDIWREIFRNNGLHLLYNGYSWWESLSWNCGLYEVTIRNGVGKNSNFHNLAKSKPEASMENIDFDVKQDYTRLNMPLVKEAFFKDKYPRWIIRTAKGKELATNGKENAKQKLEGMTDVYRYNDYFYTNLDYSQEPQILNKGKKSNIGKIVDTNGKLFESYADCLNNGKHMPIGIVVYDTNDLNVEGKAAEAFSIGQRFANKENLLCISIIPAKDLLAWGDRGNCLKNAFDIDTNGMFEKLVKDYDGTSYTTTLYKDGHSHPAASSCHDYDTEIYPGFSLSIINSGIAHSDWFLPSAGHWTLFLRGLRSWIYSFDGTIVKQRIDDVYNKAIGTDEFIELAGEKFYNLNPFGKEIWTSSMADDNKAYVISLTEDGGARFIKKDKSEPHVVYPFVFIQENPSR
ncbi:MAG: hypothetical protein K5683_11355 [Prevotella sp.]|nr:hypothetical protein [Prevotella sp.]